MPDPSLISSQSPLFRCSLQLGRLLPSAEGSSSEQWESQTHLGGTELPSAQALSGSGGQGASVCHVWGDGHYCCPHSHSSGKGGTVAAPGPDSPATIAEGEKRLHCSSSYCHFGGYLHFLTQIRTVFLQRYIFLPVALFPLFVLPGWQ